jgi:hypothetical protein
MRAFVCLCVVYAVAYLAAAPVNAAGPGITVTSAGLSAGKLVITGTAAQGVVVTIQGTAFTATANALKQFTFSVVYRTPDCKLTLATNTGTLPILIGNCGPTGVNPKGTWNATAAYAGDDLTLYLGTTYRALRANKGKRPDLSAADWQVFAARGATGAPGAKGDKGDPGDAGALGGLVRREKVCRTVSDYEVKTGPIAYMYTCRTTCLTTEIALLGVTWQSDKVSGAISAKTNAAVSEASQISVTFAHNGGPVASISYDQNLVIFCMPL